MPYDGKLLDLAIDLGDRLLQAFKTKTGIPYGTVNLIKEFHRRRQQLALPVQVHCTCLVYYHTSRDPKYAKISRRGMIELFSRRNKKLTYLGRILIQRQDLGRKRTGIGSNADSKSSINTNIGIEIVIQ